MNIKYFLLVCCVISPLVVGQQAKDDKADEDSTLYLESTLVGDKEQPTVSYFIPWKGTGTPDNLHWNIEQKNDKTLELIDRDIMQRSMSIYNELNMENVVPAE